MGLISRVSSRTYRSRYVKSSIEMQHPEESELTGQQFIAGFSNLHENHRVERERISCRYCNRKFRLNDSYFLHLFHVHNLPKQAFEQKESYEREQDDLAGGVCFLNQKNVTALNYILEKYPRAKNDIYGNFERKVVAKKQYNPEKDELAETKYFCNWPKCDKGPFTDDELKQHLYKHPIT